MKTILIGCCALLLSCSRPTPTGGNGMPRDSAQELLQAGRDFAQVGQLERAEQYLLAAIDAGVPVQAVVGDLAQVCLRGGRLRSALSHVERARRLSPTDRSLLQLSASLKWALGHDEAALVDAQTLAALPNLSAENRFFLGEFAWETGRLEEARHHLERFVLRSPGALEAPWARAMLTRLRGASEQEGAR